MVGVVRMHDDLLLLLEPTVRRRPGHGDVAVDLGLRLCVDRHVLGRERVARQAARFVDEHGALAVDDCAVAREGPHAPRPRLDVHDALGRLEVEPTPGPLPERPAADREAQRANLVFAKLM